MATFTRGLIHSAILGNTAINDTVAVHSAFEETEGFSVVSVVSAVPGVHYMRRSSFIHKTRSIY